MADPSMKTWKSCPTKKRGLNSNSVAWAAFPSSLSLNGCLSVLLSYGQGLLLHSTRFSSLCIHAPPKKGGLGSTSDPVYSGGGLKAGSLEVGNKSQGSQKRKTIMHTRWYGVEPATLLCPLGQVQVPKLSVPTSAVLCCGG